MANVIRPPYEDGIVQARPCQTPCHQKSSHISASFPTAERGRTIGIWSGFTAITSAIGPVLGGWLVEPLSWRWMFWMNLPLAVAIVGISLRCVSESRAENLQETWMGGAYSWPSWGWAAWSLAYWDRLV